MHLLFFNHIVTQVPPEKSPFLEVFYAKYMDQIIRVLTSSLSFIKENHIGDATHYETPVSVNLEMLGNICEPSFPSVSIHKSYMNQHLLTSENY